MGNCVNVVQLNWPSCANQCLNKYVQIIRKLVPLNLLDVIKMMVRGFVMKINN
jgi:hypothetical protein